MNHIFSCSPQGGKSSWLTPPIVQMVSWSVGFTFQRASRFKTSNTLLLKSRGLCSAAVCKTQANKHYIESLPLVLKDKISFSVA